MKIFISFLIQLKIYRMKKVIGYLLAMVMFFHLSCTKKEKIISSPRPNAQAVTQSSGPHYRYGSYSGNVYENMLYPDTAYPQLGNRPPTEVEASYSPDEEHIIELVLYNPANYDPSGMFSQYFNLQYRRLSDPYNGSFNVESKWYNYHPTLQAYNGLRTDTLNGYNPGLGSIFFDVNPKLFPVGYIQFRARLLYPYPTYPDTSHATSWSDVSTHGIVCNQYGDDYWNQSHDPTGGTIDTATVGIVLNISVTNYADYPDLRIVVSAFGKTSTTYNSGNSMSGTLKIAAPLNAPRTFNYSASVSIYNGSTSNKLYSNSLTYDHSIYITSSMGSNPTFNFSDDLPITIIEQ